jgi:serine/threonine protein kinase
LVLSLVPGLSLQRYMSGCGPLGESKVKDLMRSLLETLVYLHGCGIVHRDIKPDNVIVDTRDGHLTCRLVDFGLAIRVADINGTNICGTPGYIAPEILNQRPVDTQADIFSAGMLAYTALRGRNPFTHFDRKTTLSLNKRAQLSFRSPRWAKHSPSLLNLLTNMTSLDPAQRPTASECLRHPCFEESSEDSSCIHGRYSLLGTQASSSESSTNGDDRSPGADFSPMP